MVRSPIIAVFLATVALIVVPTLCSAEVLLHSCHCNEEDGCGHESECSGDPCNPAMIRAKQQLDDVDLPVSTTHPLPEFQVDDAHAVAPMVPVGAGQTSACTKLPFEPSDIPRLI